MPTSRPASVAIRAAAGDTFVAAASAPLPAAGVATTGATGAEGAGAAGADGADGAGADGAAGAGAAPEPAPISPSASPTATTSPSCFERLDSTPDSSAATSTVILSVSSSTSVSPA